MASIDILVPNYQYGRYLRQSIMSILDQNFDQLRILIIDNASTDNSVQIANELCAQDSRIELRARPVNLGVEASFNEGVDWATADYFMVLCSDDMLPKGALVRAVSVMERHKGLAFAYGAYAKLMEGDVPMEFDNSPTTDWTILSGYEFILHTCRGRLQAMAPLVRTHSQKRAGYLRPELPHMSDIEMFLRLACYGDVATTSTVQATQRLHQSNRSLSTWNDPVLRFKERLSVYDSFFKHEGGGLAQAERFHGIARASVAGQAYWTGLSHILRGQRDLGMNVMKIAFGLSPRTAFIPPIAHLGQFDRPLDRIAKFFSGGPRSKPPVEVK